VIANGTPTCKWIEAARHGGLAELNISFHCHRKARKMTSIPIRSMNASGAWSSAYLSHHENAWHYYEEYTGLVRKLAKAEDSLRSNGNTSESLIHHLTDDLRTAAYRSAASTHLYACLAMEGFLNFYGVRRLGGWYFKDKILKLSIIPKMDKLFDLCFKKTPGKAFSAAVRKTFQARNKLVHPMTTEVHRSNLLSVIDPHPEDHFVNETIKTLRLFAKEMCSHDRDLDARFHFPRTRK